MIQNVNTQTKSSLLTRPVSELLPHSEPMVLIDRVVDFDHDKLEAEVTISEQTRFFDTELQGAENLVAIEYMAQSIAALAGVRSKLSGQPVKLGFLLGTRKMMLHCPVFKLGHSYQVHVEQLYMDDSGLGSFKCEIRCDEIIVAEANLNVFETNDENQLLNN